MSIIITDIQKTLYDWVFGEVTPIRVIWDDPNAPRPVKPYITLRLSSLLSVGQDYMTSANDSGEVLIQGNREFTLTLNYYGINSIQVLDQVQTSISKVTVHLDFIAGGIAFVDEEQVNNVTELIDSRYEERAILELRFRTGQEITDTPSAIENVGIESTSIGFDLNTITIDLNTITYS